MGVNDKERKFFETIHVTIYGEVIGRRGNMIYPLSRDPEVTKQLIDALQIALKHQRKKKGIRIDLE